MFRLKRCTQADPEQARAIEQHLNDLAQAWERKANESAQKARRLVYSSRHADRSVDVLLYSHGDAFTGLWETLNSMRNVEETAEVYTTGRFEPPCKARNDYE